MVSLKLDRSELNYLESIVSKIKLYDDFKEKTVEITDKLYNKTNSYEENLNKQNNKLLNIENKLRQINVDLNKTALKNDVEDIFKKCDVLNEEVKKCANKNALYEVLLLLLFFILFSLLLIILFFNDYYFFCDRFFCLVTIVSFKFFRK
jgi:hypothetical protein